MLKKIAITGPESTGKSDLAGALSVHYDGICVPEYAREYLNNKKGAYEAADLDIIARRHIAQIQEATQNAKRYLFADTELLVMKIWYENAFKKCPDWIINALAKQSYTHYLLCHIDLTWEYDPQREHPHLRAYFLELYRRELEERKWPYTLIEGKGEERVRNAISVIDRL